MNFQELPTVLYGDSYDVITANYSKERIDEARDYICYALNKSIEMGKKCCIGCSCGKDSTLLLQLVIEAARKINYPTDDIYVTHQRTTYETTRGIRWCDSYINKAKERGYIIHVHTTPLHARYAVRTVGVGTGSHAGRQRVCTEQKTSIAKEHPEIKHMINISGTRGEEGFKRANDPRESLVPNGSWAYCFRPLKYLKESDVWGYLRDIKETDFGTKFEELYNYYKEAGQDRDGCWTCYAGKCKRDTLARMECRTRLQFLRNVYIKVKDDILHYDYQTLSADSVAGPKNKPTDFFDTWMARPTFNCLTYRPIEYCMAAYEVVKDIEARRGEILIPEEEKVFIDDIHRFRYVYRNDKIKRWMMNEANWHGYNFMDLCETTVNAVKYEEPVTMPNRTKGTNWFDRRCIEYERRGMYPLNPLCAKYQSLMSIDDDAEELKQKLSKMFYASGWIFDMNKEPIPGLFALAEDNGINVHPNVEDTELYKRATNIDYRKSIEEEFYKRKQACYELVQESHDKFPELFKEPDGLFCGDNIVKFLDENNL